MSRNEGACSFRTYVSPMASGAMSNDPSGERLEQLVLASVALTAEPSLDGVLNRVVRIAAEVIEAQYAAIGVLGPEGWGARRIVVDLANARMILAREKGAPAPPCRQVEDVGPAAPASKEREPR